MSSPDKFLPIGGQNWVQLVQHLQNSLHAQDNSIDKNYALIVDKRHAKLDNMGPIILKKVRITDEHGEVNKKIISYMKQDRIAVRTRSGVAFSPSFVAQLDAIIGNTLQGRVSREQNSDAIKAADSDARKAPDHTARAERGIPREHSPAETPDRTEGPNQEGEAPVMRNFLVRSGNNPNEVEEFTAALESMDDETYASIFGFNFSVAETDNRVTEKEEKKVEHKQKAPMQDITSAPKQTQQSLSGKLANRDATATMLQQARNTESRRFQEKRKERAEEDKEKRKEIRRDEEKREIKTEEIKKSEKIATIERAGRNAKSHRKTR